MNGGVGQEVCRAKPSQCSEGGDLREAIPAFERIAGLRDVYQYSNGGFAIANLIETG